MGFWSRFKKEITATNPWIAGFLNFFSWGLGYLYTRKRKILGEIKIKRGFFERKTITGENVEKINAEVKEGTFPKALGILVNGTKLERRHLMILDYCRAAGWLPELKNLKIVEKD